LNKLLYIIVAIFSIFFLYACSSQKSVDLTPKRDTPSWYTHPPKTTSQTLYAVGEGENREDAIANALSMMMSTLSVSIASQFDSKVIIKEGLENSNQSTVTNRVQSDVEKIRISNYELLEVKELGFRKYIVLIKSDKRKLFDSLKNEIDQKFLFIDKEKENIGSYSAIRQLSILKEAKYSVEDVANYLIVMNVLRSDFVAKEYSSRVKEVGDEYTKLLSSITFSISSNKVAKNLKAPISSALSTKKFKIKDSSGKKHFDIHITSKINRASSYGFTLARSAITITVKDYKGSTVGGNKLNITGQSTQGYEIAKESISIKLNKMIKEEGISRVIGLELD